MAMVHWLHLNNNPVVKLVDDMAGIRGDAETDAVNLLIHAFQTYTPALGEQSTQELAREVSPGPQEEVSAPVKYSLGMNAKDIKPAGEKVEAKETGHALFPRVASHSLGSRRRDSPSAGMSSKGVTNGQADVSQKLQSRGTMQGATGTRTKKDSSCVVS